MELLPCKHCEAQPERKDIDVSVPGHGKVICPKCGEEGPTKYGRTKPAIRVLAAQAWNAEMSSQYRR